ncbi:MAG: lipopolysaccharide biosynthesis protein [Anaerolineae bacterium]|nr:lipopolysaccharide biosynthesis protein [Anaerolineae bacterium]
MDRPLSQHSQVEIAELRDKAIRSARWVFLTDLFQKISGPLLPVLLARVLLPDDVGVLGIVMLVLALVTIFQQAGLGEAVIQRSSHQDGTPHIAFWLSLVVAIGLYALLWFIAPWIGLAFSEPRTVAALRVMGVQLLFSSVGTLPLSLLKREFQFTKIYRAQLWASLVSFGVAIPLALMGKGYWAVIIASLCGNLVCVLFLWYQSRWLPKWLFVSSTAWQLLRFGGFITIEMLLGWMFVYFDNALVGAYLGTAALGIYALAFNIANAAIGLPVGALTGVALSTFSRLQEDRASLRKMYIEGTQLVAAYAIPAGVGLAWCAVPLAQAYFGTKWAGMAPILSILAVYAGIAHLWILNTHVFRSIGRPDIMVKIYLISIAVILPVYLFSVRYGLLEFTIARAVAVIVVGGIVHTFYAVRTLQLPRSYLWECCAAPLKATFLMVLVELALSVFKIHSPWLELALRLVLGAAGYFVGLYLFNRALSVAFYQSLWQRFSAQRRQ